MTIGTELSGRVTTGAQQAALGRLNESFAVKALSGASAMKAFAPEMSVASAMKALAPEAAVASAMKAFAPEAAAMSAMKALARKASTTASVMKALAPEMSVASAMKAFAPEMSVASAMKAFAPEASAMSAMKALAHEASTAALPASSVVQDVAKQLSSMASTAALGRFTSTLQPELALQSAVRAYQPDLSAPFLTFEPPKAWKELGNRLQSLPNVWNDLKDQLRSASSLRVDIRMVREAAARQLRAYLREEFSRVIEFRRRAKAWLFGADTAARIRSEHNAREAFLRAVAAKRAEIAYGRAQLALRKVGCMPPGRLIVARPHLTRGPNSCKSIRTHRLAGLLRT
ncbi:hypothetical protein [Nocardia tengchongensis]|uniref:hypothetical protein n=1 Tax=Nocardia tengchongensis TaxID=2055889 RepID=UPI00369A9378